MNQCIECNKYNLIGCTHFANWNDGYPNFIYHTNTQILSHGLNRFEIFDLKSIPDTEKGATN